jgi:hypothetical protein
MPPDLSRQCFALRRLFGADQSEERRAPLAPSQRNAGIPRAQLVEKLNSRVIVEGTRTPSAHRGRIAWVPMQTNAIFVYSGVKTRSTRVGLTGRIG